MKSRFKRFGSAKVLNNLYRKHRLESGVGFDVLGTSACGSGLFGGFRVEEAQSGKPWTLGMLTWARGICLRFQ